MVGAATGHLVFLSERARGRGESHGRGGGIYQ